MTEGRAQAYVAWMRCGKTLVMYGWHPDLNASMEHVCMGNVGRCFVRTWTTADLVTPPARTPSPSEDRP